MNVRPGDLLLFRVSSSSNWLDKLIGWGQKVIHQAPTKAAYCHVALVGFNPLTMYEAKFPTIRLSPINLTGIQKSLILEVYRIKTITSEQITQVIGMAHRRLGEHYDWLAILTLGLLQIGPAAVCSQYIYECFLSANIILCPWSSLESPDNIANSQLLERID
jgi:hypothetical protein